MDETHLASKKDVDTLGQLTCCGTPERRMPASARLQAQRVRSKGEFRQQEEIKSTTGWNTDKANSSVFDTEVKSMHFDDKPADAREYKGVQYDAQV